MFIQNKFLKRKLAIISGLFCFLILSGIGCDKLSKEEEQAMKPVSLTFWTVFDDVDQLKKIAESYKSIRSYVTVSIKQVNYEEFDKLFVNALADDVAPDMISVHSRLLRKYVNRLDAMPASVVVANVRTEGKIKPKTIVTVEENRMPTKNDIKKLFLTAVADDVIIGDKTYGLPIAFDTLVMYYNKDLLDKAGIPEAPKTWEEFNTAVKKSTIYGKNGEIIQSGTALGTGKNIDNSFDIFSLLMLQNGVTMESGGRISFTDGIADNTTQHPSIEALRYYTDFARPTKDVYSWNETSGNALEMFARGKVVFFFGFLYDKPRIRARGPQVKFDIEQVPQLNSAVPVNVANYSLESVVGKSKHKDEAWDFIRYLTLPENIKKYTDATKQPSPLRAQIVSQQEDPDLKPSSLQALSAVNWYRGRDIDATKVVFNTLFEEYLMPFAENESPAKRAYVLFDKTSRMTQQLW